MRETVHDVRGQVRARATVRREQTRGRLARQRTEGLVDRITLPQTGRTRV
ncbi:hypothetical protein ACWKT3_16925 [Streptomyces violaceus]